MADATRSQMVLREVEERMGELQAVIEQRHADVKGELTQIQDSIAHLSRQMVELMRHHNAPPQRGGYQAPTRFTRMDLPKLTKDDVVGWLSKCESYFDLDKTPEENKVTMASLALDEVGYQWYDGLKKSSRGPISWQDFADGIRVRFSTTLRRPLEELVQLKQTGSLGEYQEQFERISCRINLSEEQKLDCYLGGLKDEIAWDVRLFNPRTVLEATRLAKIKELSLRSNTKTGTGAPEIKKGTYMTPRASGAIQEQKGILGIPGYRFQSRMSPAELEEHRSKSMCFFCHEKFAPGHNCPQRQKTQIFFMETEEAMPEDGGVAPGAGPSEEVGEIEQHATVSIHSVLGNLHGGTGTMRVKGSIGNRIIHILLDTGSSHNFHNNLFSPVLLPYSCSLSLFS